MAKGQKRNNREVKKPKKGPAIATDSPASFPLKTAAASASPTKKR